MTKNKHILQLLSQGADERIFTNEKELTKYGTPLSNSKVINRGSCTCSVATGDSLEQLKSMYRSNTCETDWIDQNDQIFNKIKGIINEKDQDNFELFLAPSGTDLVYIPLIIAKLITPKKKILNITTCIEELGSGTKLAAQGKYYADYNQFGEKVEKGKTVLDVDDIKTYFCRARSENGDILNNQNEIIEVIKKHPDHTIIINLVYGSKSGIEDNLELFDKIKGDNIFWNTDLCQFRHSKAVIKKLIEKNSTVMITGSKFYQCPPFCAAILIPKNIFNSISENTNPEAIKGFDSVFSSYDTPPILRQKLGLKGRINPARILKWSYTLKEIEKFNLLPKTLVQEKVNAWRKAVSSFLEESEEYELMPFQENTNKTIISFRVKYNGGYLNELALRKLHYLTATKKYNNLGKDQSMVFIGQPVTYFNDKSFLRLAIGSKNIREFVKDNEINFEIDRKIIDILTTNLKTHYEDF
jgi:hypothetical protein